MKIKNHLPTILTFLFFLIASGLALSNECTLTRPTILTPNTDFVHYTLSETESNELLLNTSATLFKLSKHGIVNEIASETSLNADANVATIKLNPLCRWSDGKNITSHDFINQFKRIFDPKNDSPVLGKDSIKNGSAVYENKLPFSSLGVKALDESTLQIEFTTNFADLKRVLSQLEYTPEPTHKSAKDANYWSNGKQKDVSSGPFVFKSVDEDKFVYVRNPHYCGPIESNIQTLQVLHSTDAAGISELLANNAIDFATEYLDIRTDDLFSHPNINKFYNQIQQNTRIDFYLFMNSKSKNLQDSEIRKAIKLAVDNNFFYGIDSPFPTNSLSRSYATATSTYSPPEYPIDNSSYKSKLIRAKSIFSKAGYTDSNPLTLNLFSQADPDSLTIMEATRSMLQQLPITIEFIKFESVEKYFDKILSNNPGYDLTSWGVVYELNNPLSPLELLTLPTSFSEAAYIKALELLKASYKAAETDKIQTPAMKLETLLAEENYVIPLSNRDTSQFVRKDLLIDDTRFLTVRNIIDPSCAE